MKKGFSLISMVLVSSMAASAQAGAKGELARLRQSPEGEKKAAIVSVKKSRTRALGVVRVGPSTTYLKNGLSLNEVIRLLGLPASVSERQDGDSRYATYTFTRGGGRVLVAEFENGLLVNSRAQVSETIALNK
ncbi:MAG TPA: hypothetical protein VF766_00460 [Pyrinomonadaceae bacterium]